MRGSARCAFIRLAEAKDQPDKRSAKADLAKSIGVKCVGQKYADADEHQECRYDFSHSFPPWIVMPTKACLRNSR